MKWRGEERQVSSGIVRNSKVESIIMTGKRSSIMIEKKIPHPFTFHPFAEHFLETIILPVH